MMVSVWRRLKIDYQMSVWSLGFSPEGAISSLTARQPVDGPYQRFKRSLREGWLQERRDQDRM